MDRNKCIIICGEIILWLMTKIRWVKYINVKKAMYAIPQKR